MGKNRLEAFSDGVMAIIITIMVLEFKLPESANPKDLIQVLPKLISYLLSFVFVGIYWVNHHHLIHTVRRVSPAILWSNMNLLFWLSLVPFSTAWMGEHLHEPFPVSLYAGILFLSGMSYDLLRRAIARRPLDKPNVMQAIDKQKNKGYFSLLCYFASIITPYVHTYISICLFFVVAVVWIVPDRRIEDALDEE
jgi:uncharacterized membrane protein